MIHLYIIGPVTGMPNDNLPAFKEAKEKLKAAGFRANIPHEFIIYSTPWNIAMLQSIHALTTVTQCGDGSRIPSYNGIAMLDGWEDSKGAKIEHDLAVALGIPCKMVEEWLNE